MHSEAMAQASWLVTAVALLIVTQMIMLVFGKKATSAAPLPLVLCIAQFATSVILSSVIAMFMRGSVPWMPRTLWRHVVPLSAVWTAGFVLFNASAVLMSPSLVSLVRCMEPLSTVLIGFILGERYSFPVLATLAPICGGVALASFKGGIPSTSGVALAMLSNVCFCCRPMFSKKLEADPSNKLDAVGQFFNITLVSVALLPPFVVGFEGSSAPEAIRDLEASGSQMLFVWHVGVSSVFFFAYQFTQLKVMSQLSPLEFSVLTPLVKAFMIVCCSLYFGDEFSVTSAIGVFISTFGGYLFTVAKQQEVAKKSIAEKEAAAKKD